MTRSVAISIIALHDLENITGTMYNNKEGKVIDKTRF
jgi:hypothetical protein